MAKPTISVVINTYNRAESLRKTLDSFPWQHYGLFEVVVVNGPSTDNTAAVLAEYGESIRTISCDAANISVSRNVGISHAAGEVVAFIDDDAIPYPNWLQVLSAQYEDPGVGGAGGFVWDHTGMGFQTRYIACDRFGEPRFYDTFDPSDLCSFPGASWYPSLIGVNSSFRRSVLLEIGGFNEQYAYGLDETDVCLRIVDRGYKIVIVPAARVHHKALPSQHRDSTGRIKSFTRIVRSRTNFIMTHGAAAHGRTHALKRLEGWVAEQRAEVNAGRLFREYSREERREALNEITNACNDTVANAGFHNEHLEPMVGAELKAYPALRARLRLVIISADFPPRINGGIGTTMRVLSTGLARLGHEVHVITRAEAEAVDFEESAWIHRIQPRRHDAKCVINGIALDLPQAVQDWAGTAKSRVDFIAADFGAVDAVISPIWDVEGCYALASAEWKSLIALHTTYAMSVDTHPEWKRNPDFYNSFISKIIKVEHAVLESAPNLLPISAGIVDEIERVYGIKKDKRFLSTVFLGVRDLLDPARRQSAANRVRGLFVGRLELRKGVDVLFDVLPALFDQVPGLSFDIVGDPDIPVHGPQTLLDEYRASLKPYIEKGRLRIRGRVSDGALAEYYNACDFFVAPSRFESFGIIFAEAMSCAKPVIGCRAGGMPEVIGDAGLLAEPGDAQSLKEHMLALATNAALRLELGRTARNRYEKLFSIGMMSSTISALLEGTENVSLV